MNEATSDEVEAALEALDRHPAIVPAARFPDGLEGLEHPGLYSWWCDAGGAAALAAGLGHPIPEGRIYAGQAGAVAWPSGTVRVSTLRSRIGGNHLRGTIQGSTFRLTLAALLSGGLGLEVVGDKRLSFSSERVLSGWMREHLAVAVHAFPDADRLGDLERMVLASLDPPLNLEGMAVTPLRRSLHDRRRQLRAVGVPPGPTVRPAPPGGSRRSVESSVTLHEEIASILREKGNPWMTTREIAQAVNERGRYHKRDGSQVTDFQIHGRTRNYETMFERDGSRVRLREQR